MKVTTESVLVRDEEPKTAEIDGEAVVLSLRAGSYFSFNRVASDIWRMLTRPCRVADIFASLMERHAVDRAALDRDVTPFLQNLLAQRLLRIVEPDDRR